MKKIPLLEKKNFGALLGDSIEFTIQNWGKYSKAFLYIVLPPLLVAVAMMTFIINNLVSMLKGTEGIPRPARFDFTALASYIGQAIIPVVLILIVSIIQYTLTYEYVLIYESKEDPALITIKELWDAVRKNVLRMLYSFLWYLFILIFLGLVSIGLVATFSAAGKGWGVMMTFSMFLLWIYAIFATTMFLIVRQREGLGLVDSIVRCFRLVNGRWWRTFGVLLLLMLIVAVVQTVCMSPLTSMAGTSTFPYTASRHYDLTAMFTPLFGLTQSLAAAVSIYFSAVICFTVCVNYYSLVSMNDGPPAEVMSVGPDMADVDRT